MPSISKLVRTGLYNRLSDPVNGFNTAYAGIVADDNSLPPVIIDWSEVSTNFWFGQVTPDLIADTDTAIDFPLLTIDTLNIVPDPRNNAVRGVTFSGSIYAIIQVVLQWDTEVAPHDFSSWPDAVESAMFQCICDNTNQPLWGDGIVFSREMGSTYSQVFTASTGGFRRVVSFTPRFDAIIN